MLPEAGLCLFFCGLLDRRASVTHSQCAPAAHPVRSGPSSSRSTAPLTEKQLTGHVDVLLAGEPDAGVKLPHHVLVLAGLPDVLHQPRVVDVGAIESDAERLPGGERAGAERLHHFARPLAPVAGGERGHGQEQGEEVQGESQRSPSPVYPHHGDPGGEDA